MNLFVCLQCDTIVQRVSLFVWQNDGKRLIFSASVKLVQLHVGASLGCSVFKTVGQQLVARVIVLRMHANISVFAQKISQPRLSTKKQT
jgi:hypothetical protein